MITIRGVSYVQQKFLAEVLKLPSPHQIIPPSDAEWV